MLLVLATTWLLALALLGWGVLGAKLLERACGADLRGALAIGEFGLLGFAVLAFSGMLANFFVPLGGSAGLVTVIAGLLGCVAGSRRLRDALEFGLPRGTTAILLSAVSIVVAGEAVREQMAYDSGLYHLQTILMAEDSRIVLGAANIHFHFGYNSAWLVLCAMFGLPGDWLGAPIALNGIACLFCFTGMVQRAVDATRRYGIAPSAVFAGVVILVIAFAKILLRNLGSPSTDLAAALFTLYTFQLSLLVTEAPLADRGRERVSAALLTAFATAALAVICKTSQAPVALAVLLVALAAAPWRQRTACRVVLSGIGTALLLALAWVLHGLALSGCLLYPVSASCVAALPWTVPHGVADSDLSYIAAFARLPGVAKGLALPSGWDWLPGWLEEIRGERLVRCLKVVAVLALFSLLLRFVARRRVRCTWERLSHDARLTMLGLLAVALLGVGYWFVTAPALRFGFGFLVAVPAILLGLVFPTAALKRSWPGRWTAPALTVVAVLLVVETAIDQPVASLRATDLPPLPVAELVERHTAGGYPYAMPKTGDQCWAAPRFCTPFVSPGLEFGRFGIWQIATAPH